MFLKKNWLIIAILFFALAIRLYRISDTPPSLNWDEISHGYNAFSIIKTGKDEWGEFLPIIFRAYGDYKLPVYIYLTSLSVFIFGLNEFAVRFVSVLAGVGTVYFTYLLTKLLLVDFEKRNRTNGSDLVIASHISAFLVAIEPWTFFLSRGAFEANLALFLFVGGIYFFFKSIKSHSTFFILLSTVFLGLTIWTYNSYRIFTPIMLLISFYIFRKDMFAIFSKSRLHTTYFMLLTALFFVPMIYQMISSEGLARYGEVRILDSGAINRINDARSLGGSRLVHNKVTYLAAEFAKNYLSHFSPNFLFINGGSQYQFNIPGAGLIYPINSILIVIGILIMLSQISKGSEKWKIVGLWVMVAPIASSLTREAPHTLRAITMLPIPMILSAIGFSDVLEKSQKNMFGKVWEIWQKNTIHVPPIRIQTAITVIYLTALILYSHQYRTYYYNSYRDAYSQSWQYGYKEVAGFVQDNYERFDKFIVTKKYGEPHEFFLFYSKWDPAKYLSDTNLNRFYQSNWYWVDAFDKFYFVNDWQISEPGKGEYVFKMESGEEITCPLGLAKCLLITSPGNVPKGWTKVRQFEFLDGKTSFELYENI